MGLRPTQDNEKRLGPASTLYGTVALSLSSRPERSGAEGPAVPQTLRGDVWIWKGIGPVPHVRQSVHGPKTMGAALRPLLFH
jgi:hypothetical protein